MSRHELTPRRDGLEVVVGWDPPLSTFFAQAWDRTVDEDDPAAELLWIGCNPGEVWDVQQVVDAVAPWAQVSDSVVGALYAEAHA